MKTKHFLSGSHYTVWTVFNKDRVTFKYWVINIKQKQKHSIWDDLMQARVLARSLNLFMRHKNG